MASVVKNAPADGKLHAGDVIKAVDGTEIKANADVAKLVTRHKPGERAVFTVIPAKEAAAAQKKGKKPEGPTKDIAVTTTKAKDGRSIVGIQAGIDYTFPFNVDIKLADVSGPSAG